MYDFKLLGNTEARAQGYYYSPPGMASMASITRKRATKTERKVLKWTMLIITFLFACFLRRVDA